jgi:hypothetical protein
MAHANARLTQSGRLLLVQRITQLGWPPAQAAEAVGVSRPRSTSGWPATASMDGWAGRPQLPTLAVPPRAHRRPGAAGPGRPAAPPPGPHRLGYHLGMPRSTIYGVLARHGLSRLSHTDRTSGVVVRYQRERPGELVHLDVKKLGRIPTAVAPCPRPGQGRSGPGHRLRLPSLGRRRPLPGRLQPDPARRDRHDRSPLPGRGGRLLR